MPGTYTLGFWGLGFASRDQIGCQRSLPWEAALAGDLVTTLMIHTVRGGAPAGSRLITRSDFSDSDPGLCVAVQLRAWGGENAAFARHAVVARRILCA